MAEELIVNHPWVEIPYFRKPLFLVLLFLVFVPPYLLMIWSGDTYHRKKGIVYRTSRRYKIAMTAVAGAFLGRVIMRQFG